jgi:hypothetical protein
MMQNNTFHTSKFQNFQKMTHPMNIKDWFLFSTTALIAQSEEGNADRSNQKQLLKEWGFFCTYYTYITVFIRNAANLTLLLLKGSKLRKGNKNEDFGLHCPLRAPQNIRFLGGS